MSAVWSLSGESGHGGYEPTSEFDPMLSKKSFWGNRLNFLKPLMRFVRRDVRDHIVS
jgi:hypothetical protein